MLELHDAGFVFAATVIDYIRTFQQQPYRLEEHLQRFRHDCAACYIPLPDSHDRLLTIAQELVAHNATLLPPQAELVLILFATPGPLAIYLGEGSGIGPPTLGMHTFPLPCARYRRFFAEGMVLAVPGVHAVGPGQLIDPRCKHRSRLHWWIADRLLRDPKYPPHAVALLQDHHGHLTETAIGSFLAVMDGVVCSPRQENILDSISLRQVRSLCERLGISFEQRDLCLADVPRFEEAMLTGTAFCLAGVRELHRQPIPWPGPIFEDLLCAWSEEVGIDIRAQILGNC